MKVTVAGGHCNYLHNSQSYVWRNLIHLLGTETWQTFDDGDLRPLSDVGRDKIILTLPSASFGPQKDAPARD